MIDFVDRILENPTLKTITTETGESYNVTVENASTVIEAGTPLNRAAMMGLQGFIANTTVFNADGSVTETNGLGQVKTTVFNADGSITETFSGEKTIKKTTTFSDDGSVMEVIE